MPPKRPHPVPPVQRVHSSNPPIDTGNKSSPFFPPEDSHTTAPSAGGTGEEKGERLRGVPVSIHQPSPTYLKLMREGIKRIPEPSLVTSTLGLAGWVSGLGSKKAEGGARGKGELLEEEDQVLPSTPSGSKTLISLSTPRTTRPAAATGPELGPHDRADEDRFSRSFIQGGYIIELHPDSQTSFRIWETSSASSHSLSNQGTSGAREWDLGDSGCWETGPVEKARVTRREGEWVLDVFVREDKGLGVGGVLKWKEGKGVWLDLFGLEDGRAGIGRFVSNGRGGRCFISQDKVVVTVAGDSPGIFIYRLRDLEPVCKPMTDGVGINTRTGLPVVSFNERLLAYVTPDQAKQRSDWFERMEEVKCGTIVSSRSVRSSQQYKRSVLDLARKGGGTGTVRTEERRTPESLPSSMQAMMMHTAAGISSEVARGVWSGLKGFGWAAIEGASRSGAGVISKSAPVVSELARRMASDREEGEGVGTRGEGAGGRERKRYPGSSWIKVVDLDHLVPSRRTGGKDPSNSKSNLKPSLIAHFALPLSDLGPLPTTTNPFPPIDVIRWDPSGTKLAAATAEGKSVTILEVRPAGRRTCFEPGADHIHTPSGQVWVRFELKRGVTNGRIVQIDWSEGGRWVGVVSRKTVHTFCLDPPGPRSRTADRLSIRLTADCKLRLSDWLDPPPSPGLEPVPRSPRNPLGREETPVIAFSCATSGREGTGLIILDPNRRAIGSFDVVRVEPVVPSQTGKPGSEAMGMVLPVVRGMWKLPLTLGGDGGMFWDLERREEDDLGVRGRTRHLFSQVEIDTVSPTGTATSIYKDRLFHFQSFSSSSVSTGEREPVDYRAQVELISHQEGGRFKDSLRTALGNDLDVSHTLPICPALPNGSGGYDRSSSSSSSGWNAQPIKVMATSARGIMISSPLNQLNREPGVKMGTPSVWSEQLILDEESGFMVDLNVNSRSNGGEDGSPAGSTGGNGESGEEEESWEDDLVAGVMDD